MWCDPLHGYIPHSVLSSFDNFMWTEEKWFFRDINIKNTFLQHTYTHTLTSYIIMFLIYFSHELSHDWSVWKAAKSFLKLLSSFFFCRETILIKKFKNKYALNSVLAVSIFFFANSYNFILVLWRIFSTFFRLFALCYKHSKFNQWIHLWKDLRLQTKKFFFSNSIEAKVLCLYIERKKKIMYWLKLMRKSWGFSLTGSFSVSP